MPKTDLRLRRYKQSKIARKLGFRERKSIEISQIQIWIGHGYRGGGGTVHRRRRGRRQRPATRGPEGGAVVAGATPAWRRATRRGAGDGEAAAAAPAGEARGRRRSRARRPGKATNGGGAAAGGGEEGRRRAGASGPSGRRGGPAPGPRGPAMWARARWQEGHVAVGGWLGAAADVVRLARTRPSAADLARMIFFRVSGRGRDPKTEGCIYRHRGS